MSITAYKATKPSKVVPVNKKIPGTNMKKTAGGGYNFKVSDWKRLTRFLILGSEGGTYYASEKKLTAKNLDKVEACIKEDGIRVVKEVVNISTAGRAPKNDPALLVLALCACSDDLVTRKAALSALPQVARTGTHLLHFVEFVNGRRGWGRLLKEKVATWYSGKEDLDLAFQVTKYKNRDGWSHRDVLRKCHPKTDDKVKNAIYNYVVKGTLPEKVSGVPALEYLKLVEDVKTLSTPQIAKHIKEDKLPMEVIPTDKRNVEVYKALMPTAGLTWLIRNLGNLSKNDLLSEGSWDNINLVTSRLTDTEAIKRSRIHPLQVLLASVTYSTGRGYLGSSSWSVTNKVVDALDTAFVKSFSNVKPTGKRIMIGLDISSSMNCGGIAGSFLTPRQAASAMLMVHAGEPNLIVKAFSSTLQDFHVSVKDSIRDIIKRSDAMRFGSTNPGLVIEEALRKNIFVDAFIFYSDCEANAGNHVISLLDKYRSSINRDAKLVTVNFTATSTTLGNPELDYCLDVVGFDSATPEIIQGFLLEEF